MAAQGRDLAQVRDPFAARYARIAAQAPVPRGVHAAPQWRAGLDRVRRAGQYRGQTRRFPASGAGREDHMKNRPGRPLSAPRSAAVGPEGTP